MTDNEGGEGMEDISLNLDDTIKAFRKCEIQGACRHYGTCDGCPVLGDYKYRYDCKYQLNQNVLTWLEQLEKWLELLGGKKAN